MLKVVHGSKSAKQLSNFTWKHLSNFTWKHQWTGGISLKVVSAKKDLTEKQGIKDSAAAHTALYYSSETSSTVTKITGMQHAWQHNILPWSFDRYTCTVKQLQHVWLAKGCLCISLYIYILLEQDSASTSNTHLPHRHNRNETSSQNKNISTNYSIIFHSTHIQPQKHLEFSRFKIVKPAPKI